MPWCTAPGMRATGIITSEARGTAVLGELIAAGLLEPADGGAVRLAPEQELHHEDELRQMFIEVVPASHELS